MKAFLNLKKVEGRKCGECTACCSRLKIVELNKDVNVDCQHLCGKSCGIYNQRPQVCQDFECIWLSGWLGGEAHRPDKLGVMFSIWKHHGEYVLHAWELWPKAFEDDKVKRILIEVGRNATFVAAKYEGQMALVGTKSNNSQFRQVHGLSGTYFSILKNYPLAGQLVQLRKVDDKTYCDLPDMNRELSFAEENFIKELIRTIPDDYYSS